MWFCVGNSGCRCQGEEEEGCVWTLTKSLEGSLTESSIKSHFENSPGTKNLCFDSRCDCPGPSKGFVSPLLYPLGRNTQTSLSNNLTCFSTKHYLPIPLRWCECSLKHFTSIQKKRKSNWKIIDEQHFSVFENMPAHLAEATLVVMDFLLLLFVILVW